MLSKQKKILTLGLSLALMMPTSLSCRVYAEQENDPDTGCSRALVNGIFDPCMVATTECSLACYDARNGKVDTTPAFCGEHKIGENPSYFLGCNEEFQKCMDKPLSFWEKWKLAYALMNDSYRKLYQVSVFVGYLSVLALGNRFAGRLGAILVAPLAIAYEYFLWR